MVLGGSEVPGDTTMRWPWQRIEPNRATLTLTDEGFIIGLPEGTTEQQAHDIYERVRLWDAGKPPFLAIFPFPIDVRDNRTSRR